MITMTDQTASTIRKLLADGRPATDELLVALAEAVRDRREHDHDRSEDFFCGNLAGWLGERMRPVLARLWRPRPPSRV